MPEQRLTLNEALSMYTVNPSVSTGMGNWRGTLEVGKEADFAVLDRDIWGCSNEERRDVKVVCTVAGGTAMYGELEE